MRILILGYHLTGDDLVDKKYFGGFSGLLLDEALSALDLENCEVTFHKMFSDSATYNHFGRGEDISTFGRGPYKFGFIRDTYYNDIRKTLDLLEKKWDRILCLGEVPFWFVTRLPSLSKHRGVFTHTSYGWALGTHSPEDVRKVWDTKPIFQADIAKLLKSPHPIERYVWVADKPSDREVFRSKIKDQVSIDVETAGNQITCIGFAPTHTHSMVIPFRSEGKIVWPTAAEECEWWMWVKEICENPNIRKILHNGPYDIQYLYRHGILLRKPWDDTMISAHSAQPEMLKSLGFLGSLHTTTGAWKTLRPKPAKDVNKSDE